jgi:drug/metabolite transporter (DMT)-like permease
MKHLRGQVVSILNVLQFVSAGIMAYFIREEVPAATFYPASALVLVGTIIVLRHQRGK